MTPPSIVLLVEEQTPAYWIQGVTAALHSALTVPFTTEVRLVPPRRSPTPVPHTPWVAALAHTLLGADRRLRRLAHWSERAVGRGPWPLGRGVMAVPGGAVSAPVPRRLTAAEPLVAPGELAISLLHDTRALLQAEQLRGSAVVWAECDELVLGGSPFGFLRALARRATTVDVVVHGARPTAPPRALLHSRCAVRSVSPSFNDELLAARVTDLLGLCLETLRTDPLDGRARGAHVAPSAAATGQSLDVPTLLRLSGRRLATAQFGPARRMQWALAYRRTAGEGVDSSFTRVPQSELLMPPSGHSWADPFPVHVDGRNLIFFEQEPLAEGRGHIAVAELLADGRMGPVHRVLEGPCHLSYPCVFEAHGEWFMIPESRAEQRVTLYRATDFPFRWTRERDLVTGLRLADATPFHREGQWWMLACRIGAGASTFEDLVGFRAAELSGPWTAMDRLPLCSDATAGRPAGHLIETPQGLLRPAQDGSQRYGYGLALQRVTQLTAEMFAEREYARLAPTWLPELRGVHTFNRSNQLTMVDVLRVRS